jgi:hypothetical protein
MRAFEQESDNIISMTQNLRQDISCVIFNGEAVEQIKAIFPMYYLKEKSMIGLAYFFLATNTGNDHPLPLRYSSHQGWDLIGKIVNILLTSENPLDYIKERFFEYFACMEITV